MKIQHLTFLHLRNSLAAKFSSSVIGGQQQRDGSLAVSTIVQAANALQKNGFAG